METKEIQLVLDELANLYPQAEPALKFKTPYELLVAVVLSAQCTDERVNKVTAVLFQNYDTPQKMLTLSQEELERYIFSCGFYRNKAAHILSASRDIIEKFGGVVPSTLEDLRTLAGVGRKTANVVRSVWFDIPSLAVDTHVERIAKRLGLAKAGDSVEAVEEKLKRKIKRERWNRAHHLFIFFGRYRCMARNPQCIDCAFAEFCKKDQLEAYKRKQKEKSRG